MKGRVAQALRSGAQAALWVGWVQALLLLPAAAALPEVGHRHAPSTPAHLHSFEDLGVLGLPSVAATEAPKPQLAAPTEPAPRFEQALASAHGRWPFGRAPPAAPALPRS
jgi:hypothetical protein